MTSGLTPTTYLVLTLVELLESATAYDLKRLAASSAFNFWSLPHSVLYRETERLEKLGLLSSEQEEAGRRKRRYGLTGLGQAALDDWRAEPTSEFLELRDPGLLRLFAGSDPRILADRQLRRHQKQLDDYLGMHEQLAGDLPPGMRLALEAGIGIEREYLRFWSAVADDGPAARPAVAANPTTKEKL